MITNMTFATLRDGKGFSLGIKTDRGILDVKRAAATLGVSVPTTIDEVLQGGSGESLRTLVRRAESDKAASTLFIDEAQAAFGPCVTHPEKIVCVGLNYARHAQEAKLPPPPVPVLFNKYNNALLAHRGSVALSRLPVHQLDYEVELVIVIGKTARNVSESEALSYVFGYCVGNDLSARDLQLKTSQWMAGKTCDGFAPIGPYLVTADQIPDPNALKLECRVNGEVRQSSNTSDMIFNCAHLISFISRLFPLSPGDLIFTGTPEGVILGYPKEKQSWLKPGDKLATTIEKLGTLEFSVS